MDTVPKNIQRFKITITAGEVPNGEIVHLRDFSPEKQTVITQRLQDLLTVIKK